MKKIFLILTTAFSLSLLFPKGILAVNNLHSDRQEFQKNLDAYKNAHRETLKLREEVRGRAFATTPEKIKEYLSQTIQTVLSFLRTAREKIINSSGVTEAERLTYLTQIDNHLAYFTAKDREIQSDKSPDELVNLAAEMKSHWQQAKPETLKIIQKILLSRSSTLMDKLEKTAGRLELQLEDPSVTAGKKEKSSGSFRDYRKSMSSAKENIGKIAQMLESVSCSEKADTYCRDNNTLLKDTHLYLVKAYQDLKQVANILK